MPELAELKLSAQYVNEQCEGKVFNNIKKNPVHKGLDITAPYSEFSIRAESRGKEMLLFIDEHNQHLNCINTMQTLKFNEQCKSQYSISKEQT